MEIYLLRHGEAVEPGAAGAKTDFDRPLTPEGRRVIRHVAQAMHAMGVAVDFVLSSPLVRAQQTAEIAADVLNVRAKVVLVEELAVAANQSKLINRFRQLAPPPKAVLLVGHEPYLSRLVSILVTGQPHAAIALKKGSLCKLSADNLRLGRCARLEWLLTPAQMKLIRSKKCRTRA